MINHEKSARERVLKRIRNASLEKLENRFSNVNLDADIYVDFPENDLLIQFATELTKVGGSFVFCANEKELSNEIKVLLEARKANTIFSYDEKLTQVLKGEGIAMENDSDKIAQASMVMTSCEFLVARLGSVLVSSGQISGRLANFIPDTHIVVAEQNQVVEKVKDALAELRKKYDTLPSMTTLITGPSRTADIEKTLVMGAHGPRELIVFVLEKWS